MKIDVSMYKKSINESSFTLPQIAIIWDFYVTKSISKSAAQQRKITDYGHSKIPFDDMIKRAGINENIMGLMADKMPKTLKEMDLIVNTENTEIDIEECRAAYLIPYQITDDEKPKPKESKAEAFFKHIRNSFAHGNTYFFDNGNVLLEDKNGSTTTAMFLLRQQTLLDWIALIDKNQKYYVLHNVCESCKLK